jgi:hypothetical protein
LILLVQVRQSSVIGDRPVCPVDVKHRVHKHGYYHRYSDPQSSGQEKTPRFLCVVCGFTISVLRNDLLPYRSVHVDRLKEWFEWQFRGGPEPPCGGEKERGCLKRATRCFTLHNPALREALGQIVKEIGADATSLWRTLVHLSKTADILHFLQKKLKPLTVNRRTLGFSLLGTYRCLAVQPIYSG